MLPVTDSVEVGEKACWRVEDLRLLVTVASVHAVLENTPATPGLRRADGCTDFAIAI